MKIQEIETKKYKVDGREFLSKRDAEIYLQRLQAENHEKSIFDALTFTVHEDHLKLMRRMYFWWWHCESGAPCVDPKRPYGNSDVIGDIGEILGAEVVEVDGESVIPDSFRDGLWERHLEMKNFLQILCYFGEIPSGSYRRKATYYEWEKVEATE